MSPTTPGDRWLQLLQLEHRNRGSKPYRTLAADAGVSHTFVGNVLTGKSLPSREHLAKLVNAITTDEDVRTLIMAEYDEEHPYAQPYRKSDDGRRELADAINNLADAIRALAERPRP